MTDDLHLCSKGIVYKTYPFLFINRPVNFHIFIFQLIYKIIKSDTINYFRNLIHPVAHIHYRKFKYIYWLEGSDLVQELKMFIPQLNLQQSKRNSPTCGLGKSWLFPEKGIRIVYQLGQEKENIFVCCLLCTRHSYIVDISNSQRL